MKTRQHEPSRSRPAAERERLSDMDLGKIVVGGLAGLLALRVLTRNPRFVLRLARYAAPLVIERLVRGFRAA